ncbi:hypothetical protein CCB80_12990 [Armatimonadetes bacterium Uphvl-Ar1]|nr:hypothetical protein CCB80_12990 [Armatimonadetes bacterium Uphvl-Ar1]
MWPPVFKTVSGVLGRWVGSIPTRSRQSMSMAETTQFLGATFDPKGGMTAYEPHEPPPSNGLTWIALSDPTELSNPIFEPVLNRFPLTLADFTEKYNRIGIESRPEGLALLTTLPHCRDGVEYHPIAIFAIPNCIITVSNLELSEIKSLFNQWKQDPISIGATSGRLLHGILDLTLDTFFPAVDYINDELDSIEEQIFSSSSTDLSRLIGIKRELLFLRKNISPIRENINSLIRNGQPVVSPSELPEFQDIYNHSLRLSENVDLSRDLVTGLMDVQLSVTSNHLNEIMRTLTVISTILMAAALIAGIYGMNFQYIPELKWLYGYPFAIGLMTFLGIGIYFTFRKLKFIGKK